MTGVRAMVMRGGTSKGLYFLAEDLPAEPEARDELLLRLMGSPDERQIDGMGGGHPLTSKVAIVSTSAEPGVDVAYLFLQVGVGQAIVSDRQTCGNLLAGVGPFALERGLVPQPPGGEARVRIRMVNTGGNVVATFPVEPDGAPRYEGDTVISGVPGTGSRIHLEFETDDEAAAAILPTGNVVDEVAGTLVTCVDNGMPVVVIRAEDLEVSGYESCEELESDTELRRRLEAIRLAAGPLMGLGEVEHTSVPKLTLIAPPQHDGAVMTRTFIPHRCHAAIGVLGAVSVATACRLPGSVAEGVARRTDDAEVTVEHPSGSFTATLKLRTDADGAPTIERAGIVRTARLLMDGTAYPRP
jgi:4-oxalomesaconate tautomerase